MAIEPGTYTHPDTGHRFLIIDDLEHHVRARGSTSEIEAADVVLELDDDGLLHIIQYKDDPATVEHLFERYAKGGDWLQLWDPHDGTADGVLLGWHRFALSGVQSNVDRLASQCDTMRSIPLDEPEPAPSYRECKSVQTVAVITARLCAKGSPLAKGYGYGDITIARVAEQAYDAVALAGTDLDAYLSVEHILTEVLGDPDAHHAGWVAAVTADAIFDVSRRFEVTF